MINVLLGAGIGAWVVWRWRSEIERLIGEVSQKVKGPDGQALRDAYKQVEEQSLGMPAVLPPPEEEKDVKTAIGAARAKKAPEGDAL